MAVVCNLAILVGALVTVELLRQRRRRFPLNVAPFWLQAVTHLGIPLGIFADTHPALMYVDDCKMFWLYYPVFHWVPFVSGILTIMWYVEASYVVQMIRAKRTKEENYMFRGKFHRLTLVPRWLLAEFAIISALLSVPQIIIFYLDYFVLGELDTSSCNFKLFVAVSCTTNTKPTSAALLLPLPLPFPPPVKR